MLEWLGEIRVGAGETIGSIDAAAAAALGQPASSAGCPLGSLVPRHASIAAARPARAARACSFRGPSGDDLVLFRVAGEERVRLGRRRLEGAALELAAAAAFRVLGEVAHDLGGPITGVVAAIDISLEPSPDDSQELLRDARAEVLRVIELVRRRREGVDLRAEAHTEVDVPALLGTVCATLAPEASRGGLRLEVQQGHPLRARIDPAAARTALTAIVLNAIDAARRRGKAIVVRAERDLGATPAVRLVVQDDGRGMEVREVALAGEAFHSTRRTGAGLGLAVAREALARCGGLVSLDSGPGAGTEATISIPLPP